MNKHYAVNDHTVDLLARAQGLYGWLEPTLPEDLAFYHNSGEPWLGCIAHEADSWLVGGRDLEAILTSRSVTQTR